MRGYVYTHDFLPRGIYNEMVRVISDVGANSQKLMITLQCRQNERDGVSDNQPYDC